PVTSSDVNAYLHEVSGGPYTAKDYRTWAATVLAASLLCAEAVPTSPTACKRCVTGVLRQVAARLGHTPTVCRTSYVHPGVLDDFGAGRLARRLAPALRRLPTGADVDVATLRALEAPVMRYLA